MELVKNIIKGIGIMLIGVIGLGVFHNNYKRGIREIIKDCSRNSKRIENVEQFEEGIKNLRRELSINEDIEISAEFYEDNNQSIIKRGYTDYDGRGIKRTYLVQLNEELANECSLRHEMYHIADGHLIEKRNIKNPLVKNIAYWYWYEPKAVAYSAYGLKL